MKSPSYQGGYEGMSTLKRKVSFGLIFLSLVVLIHLLGLNLAYAGLFGSSVPKGKEIKDPYLEQLFAPEFPYESIKVMEDLKGRRFILIRSKELISGKVLNDYEKHLVRRGVSIYGTFHYGLFSWDKTVTDYAITITRKVKGEPDTIEISESTVKDPKKNESVVAASGKDREIKIAIEKDFGKRWKKIRIIPDKEQEAPEPRIGRYPGSKLIDSNGKWYWVYVSKDSLKKNYYFYEEKITKSFKKVFEIMLARKMVSNPELYSHNPIKVFGIKTIGRIFSIAGYENIMNKEWDFTEVRWQQSIDPNISDFIHIQIKESGN